MPPRTLDIYVTTVGDPEPYGIDWGPRLAAQGVDASIVTGLEIGVIDPETGELGPLPTGIEVWAQALDGATATVWLRATAPGAYAVDIRLVTSHPRPGTWATVRLGHRAR